MFLSVHVCSCPQRVVVPWRWSSELWSSLRATNAINPQAASVALSGCVYVRINKRCCLASKSCISNRKSGGMERSCLHSRYAKRLKFSKLYLHPGHIMNDFWWGFQLSQEVKLEVCQASNPVRTHWWDFRSRAWAFCSVGQGLGPNFRTVRVFYEWNWQVGGPGGGAWPLVWLEGLMSPPFWLLLINRLWEREMMLSLDYFPLNLHRWYNWESLASGFLAQ